ncbi:hypothetical protein [Ottowia sp. VDI28]|uniref:hypothetical protein n=1 Tax=Ottowia sp. VDI28 TaxID=3133968 RepID=UPI003C2D9166
MKRLNVNRVADLRANSIVDPVTGCWHWQGGMHKQRPRIYTVDHDKGEKKMLNGSSAVWNIALSRGTGGRIPYMRCWCADCVAPDHLRSASDRAELGRVMAQSGKFKGRTGNRLKSLAMAHAARGIAPTPDAVVVEVFRAEGSIPDIARAFDLAADVVARIRRGASRRSVLIAAGLLEPA